MTSNKSLEEFFKTSIVTFETLWEKAHGEGHTHFQRCSHCRSLKVRVERFRKGILKAAELCDVALEGPEYRFLTDKKPWYGTEDFK